MLELVKGIKADIDAEYGSASVLKKLVASALNPSIRACALLRFATCGNKIAYIIARNLLISLHSIDVGAGLRIGAPLILPHPVGIVFGQGVTLRDGVIVYQGVTLGAKNGGYPLVESNVTIYPGAIVVGAITVGSGAVVGAGRFVDKSVGPCGVVK